MKQSTEELKKIIENAPEGLEHRWMVDDELIYWITDGEGSWYCSVGKGRNWQLEEGPLNDLRSESDIKEIVELREKVSEMDSKMALAMSTLDEASVNAADNGYDAESKAMRDAADLIYPIIGYED